MKAQRSTSLILLVTGFILAGCASSATPPTPLPPAVLDPCAPENIRGTADAISDLMQQFDDESALASNVPRSQLAARIVALQSIRRQAHDYDAPGCVAQLKQLQLTHMNTVIETMLAFLSRGDQGAVTTPALWRSESGRYSSAGAVVPEPGEGGFNPAGSPWELVARGIEDLQIEYRDGSGAWANQPPTSITGDWARIVRQVRITLSARASAVNIGGETTAGGGAPDAVRGRLSTVVAPRAAFNELQMGSQIQ